MFYVQIERQTYLASEHTILAPIDQSVMMKSNAISNLGTRRRHDTQPIIATANDAVLSKLSASQQGYYDDPFLPYLARDGSASAHTSINRSMQRQHISQSQSLPLNLREGDDYEHDQFLEISRSSLAPTPTGIGPDRRRRRPPSHSHSQPQPVMHQPIIRRGTHARVLVVDYAVSTFLSLCSATADMESNDNQVQIVILGSGRDTTYLRSQSGLLYDKSKAKNADADGDQSIGTKCINKNEQHDNDFNAGKRVKAKWYEVDYPSVIQSKFELLQSCDLFDFEHEIISHSQANPNHDPSSTTSIPLEKLQSYNITPKSIRTSTSTGANTNADANGMDKRKCDAKSEHNLEPYNLISFDLRNPFKALLAQLQKHHNFDTNQPTLFLMECVQMYLPEASSRSILQTISSECAIPFMAIFDPIIQNDPFGRVMAHNLTKAGITDASMSMLHCTTLKDQVEKLATGGFEYVTGCDFWNANEMILTMEDRRRANRAEMLDEVEEWMLIMRHYCFVVAAGGVRMGNRGKEDGPVGAFERGQLGEDSGNARYRLKKIAQAFCSVENGNALGFVRSKCITH